MDMLKTILVPFGVRKEIADLVHCSRPIVRKALKGESRSPLAIKIRTIALKKGGVEVNNC